MKATPHLPERFANLPGTDLVEQGLADLVAGREDTVHALLMQIGAPRLRTVGIAVPASTSTEFPENRLYLLLASEHGDAAHGVYNGLLRRLVSFEHAADHL